MSTMLKVARCAVAIPLVGVVAACGQSGVAQQTSERPATTAQTERAAAPGAAMDTMTAARLSGAFRAAAERALPAVVSIQVVTRPRVSRTPNPPQIPFFRFFPDAPGEPQPQPQQSAGSGFVFDERGYVMTNNHVIRNAERIEVSLQDGRRFTADVVGADPNTDVAVLKIEPRPGESLPVAEFGDSERLQVGDWVLALGNPLGLDFTVTAGIVSARGRSIGILSRTTDTPLEAFIQTDAAINPGNSGGPLVDLLGRVVGINTAIESRTGFYAGYGFAIPISLAVRVANDLVEHGVLRRPRLGIGIVDVTDADAEVAGLDQVSGVFVSAVQSGQPAERAGLKPGDVIVALDERPIRNASELLTTVAQRQPGERVRLTIVRDRRRQDVPVELGQFESTAAVERDRRGRPAAEELLGFRVEPLTQAMRAQMNYPADRGVVIVDVDGLAGPPRTRPGQLLLEIDGRKVESPRDVERIASQVEPGNVVRLRLWDPDPSVGETVVNYRTRR